MLRDSQANTAGYGLETARTGPIRALMPDQCHDAMRMPFKPGQSGNPKGRPRKSDRTDSEPRPKRPHIPSRHDGWTSLINGLGHADYDKRLTFSVGATCTLDPQTITDLWRSNGLAKRIIEKVVKQEFRAGFTIEIKEDDSAEGKEAAQDREYNPSPGMQRALKRMDAAIQVPQGKPDQRVVEAKEENAALRGAQRSAARDASEREEQVKERWKELNVIQAVRRARYLQRAYGGAAILLGVDDNQTVDQPLDMERVRGLRFLTVLERREIQPMYYYTDPLAPKFGEPEIFALCPNMPGAQRPNQRIVIPRYQLVHESRLVLFRGDVTSTFVNHGADNFFGDSCLQPVYESLRDFGISWSGAAVLLADFAPATMKLANLHELLSADDPEYGADAFLNRMRLTERSRSIARVTLIGKDEEYKRDAVPLTGAAEMLSEFKSKVASDADMPVTELFGDSASGLNATGEGDRKSWQATIGGNQDEFDVPALEKITACILPEGGKVPERWSITPKPLETMSAKEVAEIELIEAQADSLRIADQITSPEEVAVSRFQDGSRGLKIDFDAREALRAPAAKPVATEGVDPDTEPKVIGPSGEELPPGATLIQDDPPPGKQKPKPAR